MCISQSKPELENLQTLDDLINMTLDFKKSCIKDNTEAPCLSKVIAFSRTLRRTMDL